MLIYVGFDDTDTLDAPHGTGKVARWFEDVLPQECSMLGVVRQQLLVHENIPYTSHNSAACVVIETENPGLRQELYTAAVRHLADNFLEGSDPGLCIAASSDPGLPALIPFGKLCTEQVVKQDEALQLARQAGVHLSAHGGTGDGVIGALAGVGLTAWGWAGRWIEFGNLRQLPDTCTVERLQEHGMHVSAIDRDAPNPGQRDIVRTNGWCRPRLMGGRPVLLVQHAGDGHWTALGGKRHKRHGSDVDRAR